MNIFVPAIITRCMYLVRTLFLSSIHCLLLVYSGNAQGIRGRITDNKQVAIPFAVVYDETTLAGTTCNAEGYYELKLEPGNHALVYKAMGYYLVRKTIQTSDNFLQLNIEMLEQPVALKEVVITPGKEDPAYAIMRKVIGLAPYHLNQVKSYQAEVYLRGTAHIIKMPKFIAKHTSVNGATNDMKSGDVYVEESVNLITFKAPDDYEQKVTSIHTNFPWNNNDINPMGIINSSLYEPEIDEFISPLAPNAFNFYHFRYEGFFNEGDQVVFKIKVTPKRDSQQLMRGTIFIVDKLWCLHSADVMVKMFFGTLSYKIIYSPIKSSAWLPVSYQFYVDAAIMGIKATYKYASSVKFKQVELNERTAKIPAKPAKPATPEAASKQTVPVKADPRKARQQQEIESLLTKEDLSNRDMVKLATLMAKESPGDTAESKSLEIKDSNRKVTVEKDAVTFRLLSLISRQQSKGYG